jgi:hypothetical protein
VFLPTHDYGKSRSFGMPVGAGIKRGDLMGRRQTEPIDFMLGDDHRVIE